jgi:hypothetical protein
VHHLEQSKSSINDQGEVYCFLQKHFLHWLEALSLIGVMPESFALVGTLQSLIAVSDYMKRPYSCIYTNLTYFSRMEVPNYQVSSTMQSLLSCEIKG